MLTQLVVSDFTRIISGIELKGIGALGVLNPRLSFSGDAALMPAVKHARLEVSLRLEYGTELIGESRSQRLNLGEYGNQIYFEIVTSQRLLRHITDGVSAFGVRQVHSTIRAALSQGVK